MSGAAHRLLIARRTPLRLVIYDCDGVLIDSEPIANRIIAEELADIGWVMTAQECEQRFLGITNEAVATMAGEYLGRPVPDGWLDRILCRIRAAFLVESVMVPGALAALTETEILDLGWCVGSNSSHEDLLVKFACVGLLDRVQGRLHSGDEISQRGGRAKPAPDLFLAAASAMGVPATECLPAWIVWVWRGLAKMRIWRRWARRNFPPCMSCLHCSAWPRGGDDVEHALSLDQSAASDERHRLDGGYVLSAAALCVSLRNRARLD
jgi:beta-phosphoglucomutase-like phosphatase (HAD superfamily)